jgi:hypothetical protein
MKSLLLRSFAAGFAAFALIACGPVDESSDADVDTEELFAGASDLDEQQFSSSELQNAFYICCAGTAAPTINCGASYTWVSKCTTGAPFCMAGTQPGSDPSIYLHPSFKYYDKLLQRMRGNIASCSAILGN